MITADLTIARLLGDHPELLDVLADVHPHFGKLRSPMMRRLMAPRVTISGAARIAGIPEAALLSALREASGEPAPAPVSCPDPTTCGGHAAPAAPEAVSARPGILDVLRPVHVDARDDIRAGREPFVRIMTAVKALAADEVLVLRAPFEPVPLYEVLARRGFAHWTERHEATEWSVWFYRGAAPAADGIRPAPTPALHAVHVLDVRGMEPPGPMVSILERLDTLARGETLLVIHERRPVFLYPQLEARGFVHDTDDSETGVVRIQIRHASASGDTAR